MRVLLKLSGESLGGPAGKGIDEKYLMRYAREIVDAVKAGHQVAIVNGGGNFFRGLQGMGKGFDRITGDRMGMLATVMNALAIAGAIRSLDVEAAVLPPGTYYVDYEVYDAFQRPMRIDRVELNWDGEKWTTKDEGWTGEITLDPLKYYHDY